jgi:hypothetical protein
MKIAQKGTDYPVMAAETYILVENFGSGQSPLRLLKAHENETRLPLPALLCPRVDFVEARRFAVQPSMSVWAC